MGDSFFDLHKYPYDGIRISSTTVYATQPNKAKLHDSMPDSPLAAFMISFVFLAFLSGAGDICMIYKNNLII